MPVPNSPGGRLMLWMTSKEISPAWPAGRWLKLGEGIFTASVTQPPVLSRCICFACCNKKRSPWRPFCGLGVVFGRKLVDSLDKGAGVLRLDLRGNPVTKVEHMAGTMTVAGQNAFHFLANRRRTGIQCRWVHVALQCDFVAYTLAGAADVTGPVQTQGFHAGLGHGFQPQAATFGKQDYRNTAAFVFTDQAIDNFFHVGQ